ncbi:MAG: rod shape-determining protein RodA [Chromatiales bacterium]|nr:rod shape-determining protein RodA [Chromatiales bacterium]
MALALFGLVVLYSAAGGSTAVVFRQGARFGIGLLAMLVIAQIPPERLRRWSPVLFGVGLALLVTVLWIGHVGKGAQRWINLGFMRFQPSELVKLATPMMIAWFIAAQPLPPRWWRVVAALAWVALPVVLTALQPDLGTAILIGTGGAVVLFFGGMSWRWVGGFVAAVAAAAPALWWWAMHDYQRERVRTLLDPERDPLGAGYHIIQSKIAIGSGGVYGKGWLNGTQSQLEFLPERTTDFIFAVLSEEFGFVGVLLLLALYMAIIARGLYIATRAQDSYTRLLAGALVLSFSVYVIVNTGMVSGLLPVVGIPLPLVSYGGTSVVTLLIGFGILMSIHTHRKLLPT